METRDINELINDGDPFKPEPWYNEGGDCIEYQLADEEIVAQRVDDLLTIYHSAFDRRPIGFQIKGIRSLVRRFGYDTIAVAATEDDKGIRSVSVRMVLLAAYETKPPTVDRRRRYAAATPHQDFAVGLPEAVLR